MFYEINLTNKSIKRSFYQENIESIYNEKLTPIHEKFSYFSVFQN